MVVLIKVLKHHRGKNYNSINFDAKLEPIWFEKYTFPGENTYFITTSGDATIEKQLLIFISRNKLNIEIKRCKKVWLHIAPKCEHTHSISQFN